MIGLSRVHGLLSEPMRLHWYPLTLMSHKIHPTLCRVSSNPGAWSNEPMTYRIRHHQSHLLAVSVKGWLFLNRS